MPLLLLAVLEPSAAPSPPAAPDAPKWTDVWSALGTVGATFFAVVALAVTIVMARQDRAKAARLREEDGREADQRRREDLQRAADLRTEDLTRAAADRAEADQRLRDEREAADRRLAEERADWDRRQVRDWQAAAAVALLHNISQIQPYLDSLVFRSNPRMRGVSVTSEIPMIAALARLQQGAHTDALALGNENATNLYRNLVALVVSSPHVLSTVSREGTGIDQQAAAAVLAAHLRRYCRYVRLRLCELIETGTVPPETGDVPSLRLAVTSGPDGPLWSPQNQPPGWQEDTDTDPADPQFTPRR